MILKNKNNLRPLFTILALITTMLWWGANSTNAQAPARGVLHDFTGSGRTSFVTLGIPETAGAPITWRIAANPPGSPAFIRIRLPVKRLKSVDFPTFGRPIIATSGKFII